MSTLAVADLTPSVAKDGLPGHPNPRGALADRKTIFARSLGAFSLKERAEISARSPYTA